MSYLKLSERSTVFKSQDTSVYKKIIVILPAQRFLTIDDCENIIKTLSMENDEDVYRNLDECSIMPLVYWSYIFQSIYILHYLENRLLERMHEIYEMLAISYQCYGETHSFTKKLIHCILNILESTYEEISNKLKQCKEDFPEDMEKHLLQTEQPILVEHLDRLNHIVSTSYFVCAICKDYHFLQRNVIASRESLVCLPCCGSPCTRSCYNHFLFRSKNFRIRCPMCRECYINGKVRRSRMYCAWRLTQQHRAMRKHMCKRAYYLHET